MVISGMVVKSESGCKGVGEWLYMCRGVAVQVSGSGCTGE